MSALIIIHLILLRLSIAMGREVQQSPHEEYIMNFKQLRDCENKLSDGTCPVSGGPLRLPNIFIQMNGTGEMELDYLVQDATGNVLPPRAFHATAVYQDLLWVTGGKCTPRRNYDATTTDRFGDVWFSEDGDMWTPVLRLTGDFTLQNTDAVQPGSSAPWWSRYGHTLTTMDYDGDGVDDVMVLVGGFTPEPMNDVWVTFSDTAHCKPRIAVEAKLSRVKAKGDGGCSQDWRFVHYAPFSPRGYHAATVSGGRLFVLGGSPLNNDVWSARVTNISSNTVQRDVWSDARDNNKGLRDEYSSSQAVAKRAGGLFFEWMQHVASAPDGGGSSANSRFLGHPHIWSPRSGLVAVTQWLAQTQSEALFVFSGFGGWLCDRERAHSRIYYGCHPDYDGGTRARNDVWYTRDVTSMEQNWTRVSRAAPWGARAWGAGTVWHFPGNRTADISDYARRKQLSPKMWISGGLYYGTKYQAHNEKPYGVSGQDGGSQGGIDSRYAYLDLWWSRDGVTWNESSFVTGSPRRLDHFSTVESYLTSVDGVPMYLGKYGHTLTPFKRINSAERCSHDFCDDPSKSPAMFFVAGDRVRRAGGPAVAQTAEGYPAAKAATGRTAAYTSEVFRTALGSDADDGGRTGILCNTGAFECSGHGQCCHRFLEYDKSSRAYEQRFEPDNGICGSPEQLASGGVDVGGCQCEAGFTGEYCEEVEEAPPEKAVVPPCFPGEATVLLQSGRVKRMADLELGDSVLSASFAKQVPPLRLSYAHSHLNGGQEDIGGLLSLSYSEVIFLPHQKNDISAMFVAITTDSKKRVLATPGHLIMMCDGSLFTASAIEMQHLAARAQHQQNRRGEEIPIGRPGDDAYFKYGNGSYITADAAVRDTLPSDISIPCLRTADGDEAVSSVRRVRSRTGVYSAVTLTNEYLVVDGIVASPFVLAHGTANAYYELHRTAYRFFRYFSPTPPSPPEQQHGGQERAPSIGAVGALAITANQAVSSLVTFLMEAATASSAN